MNGSIEKLLRPILHAIGTTAVVLLALQIPTTGQELPRSLAKQSDVEAYVNELTGFGRLDPENKLYERIDVNDRHTPFLHRQIHGKKGAWSVKIKDVRLKLKSAIPGYKDKYLRTFEVLIDPNTGHLLRITSTCDVNDPNMLPEPPAEVAEAIMKKRNEIYHGFPPDPPKINFLDALDAVGTKGIGSPFLAKEIRALYVMESSRPGTRWGWNPRPVWVITLRGLPYRPLKHMPRDVPDEEFMPIWWRNRIRNVVDAVTGQVLFATTIPHPLPPKTDANQPQQD
jgi:hypothetical protein